MRPLLSTQCTMKVVVEGGSILYGVRYFSSAMARLDWTALHSGLDIVKSLKCLLLSQLLLYFSHLRTDDEENDGAREIPGLECVWSDCTGWIILDITEGKIKTQYPDSRGARAHFDLNVMKEQYLIKLTRGDFRPDCWLVSWCTQTRFLWSIVEIFICICLVIQWNPLYTKTDDSNWKNNYW